MLSVSGRVAAQDRVSAGVSVSATVARQVEIPGTIDRQAVLDSYDWRQNLDDQWFLRNIPFLEVPDDTLQEVWYYRWELVTKHLTYGSPRTGWMFTEFIDRPFWSGTYGGIACPLGHQMTEIRWLRDRDIVVDFTRYWLETPGALPRNYSNWYGHAAWQTFEVLGEDSYLDMAYPFMKAQYEGWVDERYDPEHGLFAWNGLKDGMEVNINSRLTENEQDGAEGYRPTLNSYMIADTRALAFAAERLGHADEAARYAAESERLRRRMIEELWDPERSFFFHQFAHDEQGGIEKGSLTYETGPYEGDPHGRELLGYVPWQFNIPGSEHADAWRFLMDPDYFHAPFGPTTLERGDPQFLVAERCCVWSGNSWPFATTQTLVAMANLLNDYEQEVITPEDYREILGIYARTHYKAGRPYLAEALDPFTGSWDGHDLPGHSEHYFHSAFNDLVITGLLGIRPSADDTLRLNPLVPEDWDWFALEDLPYHGHRLTLVWDRHGTKYDVEPGFHVYLNGERIGGAERPAAIEVPIAGAPGHGDPAQPGMVNLAVNNGTAWPRVSASFSDPETPPGFAVDGGAWYDRHPPNRWTTAGSPNGEDWIRIDLGAPRSIAMVSMYFLDDTTGVVPPGDYRIEMLTNGKWAPAREISRVPDAPTGRRENRVRLEGVEGTALRVIFEHADGGRTGLTEIQAWTPADSGSPLPDTGSPNLAFNDGTADYPRATASIAPGAAADLLDGIFGMTTYQGGRWTAAGTESESDFVEIEFGREVEVARVDAYLWGRPPTYLSPGDDRFREPRAVVIETRRDGEWIEVSDMWARPESPLPMARNVFRFSPRMTDAIRVHFEHDLPGVTGATELQVFGSE